MNNIFDFKPIPTITPRENLWENGTWKFGSLEITPDTAYEPSFIDIILKGNTALTLVNAKANGLEYLKLYGGCEQASTPTPTTPVDIVCNNGALTMVDDELPEGYKRVLGYTCNNDVLWRITDFKLRGSDTIRISFSVSAACNVFGCYQGTNATDNYDLYVSTTSGSKYFRYGSGTYLSYWSNNDLNKRFDVVYTPNGSQGMPQDSTWTPQTFTSANDLIIGSTSLTGSSSKLKGDLYGNFEVDNRLKLIPCERTSDNSLGYYDTYSRTFFEPTGTPTSLGYDGSHYVLTVDGTTETVEVDTTGDTATAENLLGVANVSDIQEVLSGEIIRNISYKIFDGTESFGSSSAYGTALYIQSAAGTWKADKSKTPMCTHFLGIAQASGVQSANTCFFNASGHFYFRTSETAANFKTWLTDLYNAGTPMVLVYVSSAPTTETVTGQPLAIQAGTNVVEITQASINNLELEVSFKQATI